MIWTIIIQKTIKIFVELKISESDAVVRRKHVSKDANPEMKTFPIKKRINTKLFIERMAALFLQNGMINNTVRVVNHC